MEKALTFEEWDKDFQQLNSGRHLFDLARKGMIPESEAVRIPPASKWPDEGVLGFKVSGVGVYYTSETVKETYFSMWGKAGIEYIPRPTPAWTPKVGDAVFWTETDSIRKVSEIGIGKFKLSTGPWATIKELKPASSIDQIGKPWDEIPGGVE